MNTLSWIMLSSLAGGLLSVGLAAAFSYSVRPHMVTHLVSYAIGALLGAVFLEILPHSFEMVGQQIHLMTGTILFGILLFFTLEKLVLWRHCHGDSCEVHGVHEHQHDHGRSGMMIMVGDTFHNFVDGILIAAAFMADTQLGIVTSVAIIAHEIPQEVGDFIILLHSGYSKVRAFAFNLFSSFATILGGLLGYFTLSSLQFVIPYLLGIAAASMIYVAVADLIPGLHKRHQLRSTIQQVLLIGFGISTIWLVGLLIGEPA
ncbi:MAG: ZIP family metal transporter [Sulfuricellaceae bacterium]|nr:ZIP family metal transporter [Sulfuricellaceae bacterium]